MILVALLLVGGFVLAGLLTFGLAVRPPPLAIDLRPSDVGLAVDAVSIRTADELQLSAWVAARPGRPAVILLHGYPADKRDLLPLAAALHRHFTVLLLDLRYFGQSEGRVTTLGHRERDDLKRTVDVLEARGLGPVGVFGFSFGGAVALLTAAEDRRIRAVAAYAAFADLRALGRDLYWYLWLLREPLVGLMRWWSWCLLGVDITRPSPEEAAGRLAVPVLLIHSRGDEQIPFHHAERLARALAGNPGAQFVFTDEGYHGGLGAELQERLTRFFLVSLH
jgi:pimeloyl-ACP methyl ester carboxylesterase